MPNWNDNTFRIDLVIPLIGAGVISYFASFMVAQLNASQIQPIASTVATIAGILFGFVMASVTLIASAKDNTLVKNTKKTQYLPNLVSRLHRMMAWLLVACIVFLTCLFLPDTAYIPGKLFPPNTRYVTIVLDFGVFVFSISVLKFIFVWREFSKFASNM